MRTEAEISHLWQFAHLKFYFGEELAVHSMQAVDSPAMEFAAPRGENEFRLNRLHQDSQLASRKYTLRRKVGG